MTTYEATSIGQVVEASVRKVIFQLYEDLPAGRHGARAPLLGDVVTIGGPGAEVYAVVVAITTGGLDGTRRLLAHGRDQEGYDAAIEANPHLAHILRTTCEAVVVAHRDDGRMTPYSPPSPPRVWDGVAPCREEERRMLANDFETLRPLVVEGAAIDDATAALVRSLSVEADDPYAFRLNAGKALARLLTADPSRLTALLRRIRP